MPRQHQPVKIKTTRVLREVEKRLVAPKRYRQVLNILEEVFVETVAGAGIRKQITDKMEDWKLEIKRDSTVRNFPALYAAHRDFHPLEMSMAFFETGYICFGAALFWNKLTDQIPSHYYIANERRHKAKGRHSVRIDNFYLQEQFMKPPRETSLTAEFRGVKYSLLSRDATDNLGVINRRIEYNSQQIKYRITDLERTLLDCAVYPEKSGGIKNVIEIYENARGKLRTERLIIYYKTINYTYPYWQRIGLILEKTQSKKVVDLWKGSFGKPRQNFYIDRSLKSNWIYDDFWKVAFPPGLFK